MSRGEYLAAHARLDRLAPDAHPFNVKGGGHMIDLFARFPHTWFRPGQVREHLERCGVPVSRNHVSAALDHLAAKMAFLEKDLYGERGKIKLYRYRRAMTEIQREVSLRASKRKPLAEAMAVRG